MIIVEFPWVNITPSLHKLLAHCAELIRDCNNGRGLKELSEGLEACKKLILRFREHLARKTCFSHNYHKGSLCGDCGEYGHTNHSGLLTGSLAIF